MSQLTLRTAALVYCLAVLCAAGSARADFWTSPEVAEYISANGQFVFIVTPRKDATPCMGELFRVTDGKRERVWNRALANGDSPVSATVADSGDFVVTFDDWGRCGELPVVIYHSDGSLKRAFSLAELGIYPDVDPLKVTVSSIWWRSGALIFTGVPLEEWQADRELLFVRLAWGRWIVIALQSGEFLRMGPDSEEQFAEGQLKRVRAFMRAEAAKLIALLLDDKDDELTAMGCRLAAEEAMVSALPKIEAFKTRMDKMEKNESRDRLIKSAESAIARLKGREQKEQKDFAQKVHQNRLEELKRAYQEAVEEEKTQYKWQQELIKANGTNRGER